MLQTILLGKIVMSQSLNSFDRTRVNSGTHCQGRRARQNRHHVMAEDIATRYDAKRQLTYQPTYDGIAGGQKFDRA